MPRSGSGIWTWPAGSFAVSNTPISSVAQNGILAAAEGEFNSPRPVSAGGTGATSPAAAFEALSPMTARGDLVTRDATVSKRLPIGAAGTVLSSDGLDPIWKSAAATEAAAGMVEIATEEENAARTSATLVVAPKYNPLPPGHLFGCELANGAETANDIAIAAGKARDSTDAVNIILTAGITKQLNAAWAVGNNNGGLDTGTVANGTYHVWLIKRADTGVVDALFSLSATAPTMPADYTHKRRIGSILREGTAPASIVAFRQMGDRFLRAIPYGVADANPGTAAVTRTLRVPNGIQVNAIVIHSVIETASNPTYYGLLSSLLDPDTTPSVEVHDVAIPTTSGASTSSVSREVTTNISCQIRSRLTGSVSTTTETFTTFGWIDTRGRL